MFKMRNDSFRQTLEKLAEYDAPLPACPKCGRNDYTDRLDTPNGLVELNGMLIEANNSWYIPETMQRICPCGYTINTRTKDCDLSKYKE